MIELAHFILFLSFGFGLVALYICLNIYRQSQNSLALTYFYILLAINIVVFVHVLEAFFKTIISEEIYDSVFRTPFLYLIIVLAPVRLFAATKAIEFSQLSKKKKWSHKLYLIPAVYFIFFILATFLIENPFRHGIKLNVTLVFSIHVLLNIALIYLGYVILSAKLRHNLISKNSSRLFGISILIYAFGSLFCRGINFPFNRLHEDPQMLALGSLDLFFNFFNIILINKVFINKNSLHYVNSNIDVLYNEFGITNREKDIIKYICEGKTNKEIAKLLFIAPVTVRDHISNILRKTNVKNRTQLAGLFQ